MGVTGEGFKIEGVASGATSTLSVVLAGPGTIRLDWRSGGDAADQVAFVIDATPVGTLTGGDGRSRLEAELAAGSHLLHWNITESGTSGKGSGQVRRHEWIAR